MRGTIPWETIIPIIRKAAGKTPMPSVSEIASKNADPFRVLISTMISLRTKDEVTAAASQRLFKQADTPETMAGLSSEEIAECIYPAGFYRTKAVHIKETARIIRDTYQGMVPDKREELLSLPGVGVKTANLTLNLGFGIEAICVDTHVHRIANRTGWVSTGRPEETEAELMKALPRHYWIEINELLVRYGQSVCTPVSPRCSTCSISGWCERRGVEKSR